jgi:hypothetical protein
MTLKSWQSPICLVACDVEQDVGSALCQKMSSPSQKYFPSAQSLYAARFVERTPVRIAPPILDFLQLCMLRELRLLRSRLEARRSSLATSALLLRVVRVVQSVDDEYKHRPLERHSHRS